MHAPVQVYHVAQAYFVAVNVLPKKQVVVKRVLRQNNLSYKTFRSFKHGEEIEINHFFFAKKTN